MGSSTPLRLVAAGLLGAAGIAVGTAPAGAADPAPTPCNGIFQADPKGDGVYNPVGSADFLGTQDEQAPPQLDVTNVFLNYKAGADGKKALTVNIQLDNLTKETMTGPGGSGGNWYYSYFRFDERTRYVRAANQSGDEITYAYGYVMDSDDGDPESGVYVEEGDTTGTFTEGPGGVVSIVIPEAIGGKPGATLEALAGTAETIEGRDDFAGFNHQTDTAPDEYSVSKPEGPTYKVVECPADGGTTTTPTTTTAPSDGPPPPTPQSGAPATLPFKAASTLGSARKAKKTKSLKFKVTAAKAISSLRLALKPKRGPAVGTASIASLKQGTSTIKLKTTKKLKKGTYTLSAVGTVDGHVAGTAQKVKVKK